MTSGISSLFTNAIRLPAPAPQAINIADIAGAARADSVLRGDAGREPAVLVSLSENATVEAFERRRQDLTARFTERANEASEFSARMKEKRDDALRQNFLRFFAQQQDQLTDRQAEYNRILNTKPVPPQQLTGNDKARALEMLDSRGYARPGTNQTVSFTIDRLTYTFKGDGSVWTNDGTIPTSEAGKQLTLATLSRLIGFAQQEVSDLAALSGDALKARIDDLYRRFAPPA